MLDAADTAGYHFYYDIYSNILQTSVTVFFAGLHLRLRLGRKRQVWFIPLADERGVCR